VEHLLDEVVGLLAAGPVALEAIEQRVKAEGMELGSERTRVSSMYWGRKSELRNVEIAAGASQSAARPGKIALPYCVPPLAGVWQITGRVRPRPK
jgi:hypothetical protein